MPLVKYRSLHSYDRLAGEGVEFCASSETQDSDQPDIHIGFLNMMPDKAFLATERQFIRLIAAGSASGNIFVRPFSAGSMSRELEIRNYISQCYESFSQIRSENIHALVLTGANPACANLEDEDYWPEFVEVVNWAQQNVTSILCSCLATHAVVQMLYGIKRIRCVPDKRWGVYSHDLGSGNDSLTAGLETPLNAPHSHVYEVTDAQLRKHGLRVLAKSPEADFHLAVSDDGLKWVYLQGHPEYDSFSLLKEYKREVTRFVRRERNDYPPYPENYFSQADIATLNEYRKSLETAIFNKQPVPEIPEEKIASGLQNTWGDSGKVLFRNWISQVVNKIQNDSVHQSMRLSA